MTLGRSPGRLLSSSRTSMWLLVLFLFYTISNVVAPHGCNDMGIDTFCIIANHFKSIYESTNPNLYKQFKEIIDILPSTGFKNMDQSRHDQVGQIYSYQTNCELDYIHGPFADGEGSPGGCSGADCHNKKNPYSLKVTEIEVNGERMHNWLHITIKGDEVDAKKINGGKVTGKFKYAFLVVHDDRGFAVGDFNHHLPCGSDCDCTKEKFCYHAKAKHSIPCMYTQKNVITHPGMLMMYIKDGASELHATWHFAQYQQRDIFTPELHFKALLIESLAEINQQDTTRTAITSHDLQMKGIFGWNPRYDILWPTEETLGAWDHFRTGVYDESLIKCHKDIDPKNYITETYPTIGAKSDKILEGKSHEIRIGAVGESTAITLLGAKNWWYSTLSQVENRLYYGYWKPDKPIEAGNDNWMEKKEGSATRGKYRRITTFPDNNFPKPPAFESYKTVKQDTFDSDQCACHALGTTPPPADVPPPPIQVQGRKAHATQMIIAWLCLVPFGIFVARYYKETYSKVFFLQEFWWFTIHVLCFVVAAMFMFGGIYSLEIQRKEPIRWGDKNILLHGGIGSVAIGLFMLQILLGHQRMRNVNQRMLQIMLHWCFGFVEYILAISSMLLSGMILKGCLPCDAFYAICIWVGVQIVFYVFMEIHMRFVDRELNLEPKRTYLPPPVMRVFHMNAPKSKLRIVLLVLYGICCTSVYAVVHVLIKYNEDGESCFKFSPEAENVTARPLTAFHRRVHVLNT